MGYYAGAPFVMASPGGTPFQSVSIHKYFESCFYRRIFVTEIDFTPLLAWDA